MCRRIDVRFPQHLAGLRIEGAELRVQRRANEDEAAGRGDRAAHVWRAGVRDALLFSFGKIAERYSPRDFSGVRVDRDELAPRRGFAGALRVRVSEEETRRGA